MNEQGRKSFTLCLALAGCVAAFPLGPARANGSRPEGPAAVRTGASAGDLAIESAGA